MNSDHLPWWDERLAYSGDPSKRVRDYRRLQSRWREVALDLPPGSYVDRNGLERPLGSRLPDDARPEHQLLSDEAVAYTSQRLPELEAEGRKAEPGRLWKNMLSSQPLCFSLFGHLNAHRDAGARVLDSVLPWPVDTLEAVVVEHSPAPAAQRLGGHRPDNTAFDAMLVVTSQGARRLVGVETKYTEPFSQKEYDKESYRTVCESQDTWFVGNAADTAKASATNQLWRNTMLAQEASRDEGCIGSVVVVSAAEDVHAAAAVEGIRPLLHNPDEHLAHVVMEDMMSVAMEDPSLAEWASRFNERYLDLTLAAPPSE